MKFTQLLYSKNFLPSAQSNGERLVGSGPFQEWAWLAGDTYLHYLPNHDHLHSRSSKLLVSAPGNHAIATDAGNTAPANLAVTSGLWDKANGSDDDFKFAGRALADAVKINTHHVGERSQHVSSHEAHIEFWLHGTWIHSSPNSRKTLGMIAQLLFSLSSRQACVKPEHSPSLTPGKPEKPNVRRVSAHVILFLS